MRRGAFITPCLMGAAWFLVACGPAVTAPGVFTTSLQVERIDDANWRLLAPLCYTPPNRLPIEVPSGFITDFASVPRWLTVAYALTGGTGQPAAVIHDYLYQTHRMSRELADETYYGAMLALQEPWWRVTVMYVGVRAFGASQYGAAPFRYREKRNFLLLEVRC